MGNLAHRRQSEADPKTASQPGARTAVDAQPLPHVSVRPPLSAATREALQKRGLGALGSRRHRALSKLHAHEATKRAHT